MSQGRQKHRGSIARAAGASRVGGAGAMILAGALLAAGALPALSQAPPSPAAADTTGVVVLETRLGRIVIELRGDVAPRHAANFRRLVAGGYYDSTTFHRALPGLLIQGGDPNSRDDNPHDDGRGGPAYTLAPEISLPHVRGAVAAARLPDGANPGRESHGSQFFILLAPQPGYDLQGYTVFGHVSSGLAVADRIAALGRDPDLPRGPAGPNPGDRARILRATLESRGTPRAR